MKDRSTYWDDFLNPVLVKEMRQFFHNRLFLLLGAVLLGIQLLSLFVFETFSLWKEGKEAGSVFMTIETILMYLSVFSAAVWSPMQRFTLERSSKELDLTNVTLLTPWQIIGGKLASSLVIWALTAALCLPFVFFAYFFRNVSLHEIFASFAPGMIPALVLIQAGLFCGAVGKKWVYFLFACFAFQIVVPMGLLAAMVYGDGKGLDFFWTIQSGGVLLFIFLLASSIALVTPPYANRMFPLRLLLTVMFLVSLAVLPFSLSFKRELELLFAVFPLGVICCFAILAACDRDLPGGRVLAQVPRNRILKFFHYLFSSNRTGGVICTLLMLLIWGAELLLLRPVKAHFLSVMTFAFAGYMVFYAEAAVLLNRRIPAIPGWGWLLIVNLGVGLLPMFAAAGQDMKAAQIIISPFSLLAMTGDKYDILTPLFWLAPAASCLAGVFFLADMARSYKNYRAPALKSTTKE